MDFHLREAVKSDMKGVWSLIHELAVFEKEPQAVEVSIADLERDGFGSKPLFHCFVAEKSAGEIVGITVDGLQLGLINNIIINFARNFRENWSIGITILNVQAINNALGINSIVIPYIGLQKKF